MQMIEGDALPESWAHLAALRGEALRMTGDPKAALVHLREASTASTRLLPTSTRSSVWLDISLAEQTLENREAAIDAARTVMKVAELDNGTYLHASAIIAELELAGEPRTQRLREILEKARHKGFDTLVTTLSLQLSNEAVDAHKKLEILQGIGLKNDFRYNETRAIVAKARAIQDNGKSGALKPDEMRALLYAYSYCYTQRFYRIFDDCHECLWQEFAARGEIMRLMKLFKYSSFAWRIRGEDAKEVYYARRMREFQVPKIAEERSTAGLVAEIVYFWRRLKVIVLGE
jgi:hypothetical protein